MDALQAFQAAGLTFCLAFFATLLVVVVVDGEETGNFEGDIVLYRCSVSGFVSGCGFDAEPVEVAR